MRTSYADLVDPYIGSIGHLLTATRPLTHLPHGMAQIMPIINDKIIDRYTADIIYGFPLNGSRVMPGVGDAPTFRSQFDHDLEDLKCYEGRVFLEDSGIWAAYTVTSHCVMYRFDYPKARAWTNVECAEDGALMIDDGMVAGHSVVNGVKCYFALTFSEAPASFNRDGRMLRFEFDGIGSLIIRAGFSYINEEQAKANLKAELDGHTFEQVSKAAKDEWNKTLGRIEVTGGDIHALRTFYTALYRVHQRMINITEYGRYFSGFDGRVHTDDRDFYVNDGIWDTYRGAHPLQLLLEPDRQMDIIHSYLRMYRQCGYLPSFPHLDGARPVMLGKHATAMIVDTWMKGHRDFDAELAYEAMVKNADKATKLPWADGEVTEYDECYFNNGFFPALPEGVKEPIERAHPFESRQCVSVTLETAYDDWCLSLLAKVLGREEDAQRFWERGQNYKKVFNPETKFMSPRMADGQWVEPFDPKLSGGQGGRAFFAECNSWTYTMHVQHDVYGLIELFGGREAFVERMDAMFREQYGTSKFTFLGQFPDSTGLIGQFCMGNEPSFHIPYMYNHAGQPHKAQRKLREIMKLWFNDTPLGICGDEDGGAMSAWYVFSAMGFYPFCPGKPEYEIGSPIFDSVKIHLSNGNMFEIETKGQSDRAKYIKSATKNGKEFNLCRISHEDILSGAKLCFEMSERPNERWGVNS